MAEIRMYDLLNATEVHQLSTAIRGGRAMEVARGELEAKLGQSPSVGQWANFVGLAPEDLMATNAKAMRAKRQLVTANLRLVNLVVNRHRSRARSLTHQDLMQEGALGLMRAVEKFDPSRGTAFSTCAVFWIRAAVLRAIQDQDHLIRLPVSQHEVLSKLLSARRAFEMSHGHEPTNVQLATELGVSVTEVRRRLELVTNRLERPVVPLDSVASSASAFSSAYSGGAGVVDGRGVGLINGDVQQEVANADVRADIARVLESHLSRDEVQAIRLRFGLDLMPAAKGQSDNRGIGDGSHAVAAPGTAAAPKGAQGASSGAVDLHGSLAVAPIDFSATYASVSRTTGLRSMREIGLMMHIGKERARYIVRRALEKLDQVDGLEDYLGLV